MQSGARPRRGVPSAASGRPLGTGRATSWHGQSCEQHHLARFSSQGVTVVLVHMIYVQTYLCITMYCRTLMNSDTVRILRIISIIQIKIYRHTQHAFDHVAHEGPWGTREPDHWHLVPHLLNVANEPHEAWPSGASNTLRQRHSSRSPPRQASGSTCPCPSNVFSHTYIILHHIILYNIILYYIILY